MGAWMDFKLAANVIGQLRSNGFSLWEHSLVSISYLLRFKTRWLEVNSFMNMKIYTYIASSAVHTADDAKAKYASQFLED